jgi:hypothetical protein
MGRKSQAPEMEYSTQRRLEKVPTKARNLNAVLFDKNDDNNVSVLDYVAARGQLQHSWPSDLAQGRLVTGENVTFALQ